MGRKNSNLLYSVFIIAFGGGLLFYYFYNPNSDSFLIRCPFKTFTHLDCPGCGSQRALHSLLHGEFRQAFSYNPLFIVAIPYVLTGVLFEWFGLKYSFPKIRKILFGSGTIYLIAFLVILFFIFRNI